MAVVEMRRRGSTPAPAPAPAPVLVIAATAGEMGSGEDAVAVAEDGATLRFSTNN